MATRSTIAIELESGKVKQIYCHWDGYLSNNGRILFDSYSDPVKVQTLISLGDVSSLGTEIGEVHPFDMGWGEKDPIKRAAIEKAFNEAEKAGWTTFYGRDRGEKNVGARVYRDFNHYAKDHQYEEYEYIFRADGKWYVSEYGRDYRPLIDALEDDDES